MKDMNNNEAVKIILGICRESHYSRMVTIRELVGVVGDREATLAALRQLRRDWRVSLESADGRQVRMSPEELAAGIRDEGTGRLLVYASFRE